MSLRIRSQLNLLNWNAPFFGLALAFIYTYAFQATKPSPFSYISIGEHVLVVTQLLGIAAILAMVYAACGWVVHKLLKQYAGIVIRVISVFLLSVFLMIVIDNFMYTLLGKGVKSTDSLLLRILVAYAAIRVAMDLEQLPQKCHWLLRLKLWLVPLAASISLVFIAWGFSSVVSVKVIKPLAALPNILILSSDGIDANHMGIYGYQRETTPFMTSKMDEFAIFENSYTNNANTTGSIVSLLTGTSPIVNGVVYPPDILRGKHSTQGLPQILGDLGYRRSNWGVSYYASAQSQNIIGAFYLDNGSRLFPIISSYLPQSYELSRWLIIDIASQLLDMGNGIYFMKPFDNPFNIVTEHQSYSQDSENIEGVLRELSKPEPVFVNTHFMMTHGPYFTVKSPFFSNGKRQSTEWETDFYNDSIRDFDSIVGSVYKHLESTGELDRTILIITSDHGSRWSTTQRIPLMIRFPKKELAGKYGGVVQRLDIAPTIMDIIGLPLPEWMKGESLLKEASCSRAIYSYGILRNNLGASPNSLVYMGDISIFDNHTLSIVNGDKYITVSSDDIKYINGVLDIRRQIKLNDLANSCKEHDALDSNLEGLVLAGLPALVEKIR